MWRHDNPWGSNKDRRIWRNKSLDRPRSRSLCHGPPPLLAPWFLSSAASCLLHLTLANVTCLLSFWIVRQLQCRKLLPHVCAGTTVFQLHRSDDLIAPSISSTITLPICSPLHPFINVMSSLWDHCCKLHQVLPHDEVCMCPNENIWVARFWKVLSWSKGSPNYQFQTLIQQPFALEGL